MGGTPTGPGLRERKRRATRSAIERNAVRLVLEHGFENVTVEMICEASDISGRTFFNHFRTKDMAVVGDPFPDPDHTWLEDYLRIEAPSALEATVRLIADRFPWEEQQLELAQDRMAILRSDPRLATVHMTRWESHAKGLAELVVRRLEARPGEKRTSLDAGQEAQLLVHVVFSTLVFGFQTMIERGEILPPTQIFNQTLDLIQQIASPQR